ncbi:MAG: hypothetical protein HC942_28500 [Microcoleus sp. SU_5_6]|nr:hypothetical protein [Microcoleus sp. SU_5_6]
MLICLLSITNYQFPITNSQFPIPNSQFPIPNSQFPITKMPFLRLVGLLLCHICSIILTVLYICKT